MFPEKDLANYNGQRNSAHSVERCFKQQVKFWQFSRALSPLNHALKSTLFPGVNEQKGNLQ